MLKSFLKRTACFAFAVLTVFSIIPTGLADSSAGVTAETKDVQYIHLDAESENAGKELHYTNPETGFEAVLLDDYRLLSPEERSDLLTCMEPLTQFGNIAFWSTGCTAYTSTLNGETTNASSHMEIARLKRRDLFKFEDATIFMVNMGLRQLTIQSYGRNLDVLKRKRADVITNNVRGYATAGNYYETSRQAMLQMYTVFNGGRIPQPMKYMSNLCIALMLGLLTGLFLVLRKYDKLHAKSSEKALLMTAVGAITYSAAGKSLKRVDKVYSPKKSSGGYSCYSCTSCSGGSGGSGGSSCGGCGGGGSSSF